MAKTCLSCAPEISLIRADSTHDKSNIITQAAVTCISSAPWELPTLHRRHVNKLIRVWRAHQMGICAGEPCQNCYRYARGLCAIHIGSKAEKRDELKPRHWCDNSCIMKKNIRSRAQSYCKKGQTLNLNDHQLPRGDTFAIHKRLHTTTIAVVQQKNILLCKAMLAICPVWGISNMPDHWSQ